MSWAYLSNLPQIRSRKPQTAQESRSGPAGGCLRHQLNLQSTYWGEDHAYSIFCKPTATIVQQVILWYMFSSPRNAPSCYSRRTVLTVNILLLDPYDTNLDL